MKFCLKSFAKSLNYRSALVKLIRTHDSDKLRSFEDRVCHDLCEELLKYLPIRPKCVSKQFQRCLVSKQNILSIYEQKVENLNTLKHMIENWEDSIIYYFSINCKKLEFVLKNCPNMTQINIGSKRYSSNTLENFNQVLEWFVFIQISKNIETVDKLSKEWKSKPFDTLFQIYC